MFPRPPSEACGGDLEGIPLSRRYSLCQDRIVLTPCVQTALDPVALLQQAGLPRPDAGDGFLVNGPGRVVLKLGLLFKKPPAPRAGSRALLAPRIVFFPGHRTPDPIRILLEGKTLVSAIRILYRMGLSAVNFFNAGREQSWRPGASSLIKPVRRHQA
jgi:hypothetical protein